MDYRDIYNEWENAPWLDEASRAELLALDDEKEIEDRFYTELEFGTAGMRGVIGAGLNRMNIYVVRRATQGLSEVIRAEGGDAVRRGVLIGYDSRHYSPEFAMESAKVLAANGIKAYVYPSLRPVPLVSFGVRRMGCIAGIMITASHNPPQYNGYKVYWEDGGQLPPEPAANVLSRINAIKDFGSVSVMEESEARAKGLIETVPSYIDDDYIARVRALSVDEELIREVADDLKIVYTPLHGSGNVPVQRILKEIGVRELYVVPEQEAPDGDFPTVKSPNPEDPAALELATELARKKGAELVIGTDPDCDRIGLRVLASNGEYVSLTGNQTACLIMDYILGAKKRKGILPDNAAVIKTIVSTDLANAIAADYGVKIYEVLTGFKFIAEKMHLFETTGSDTFMFGFEESYGVLAGDFVRDKDAVIGSLLACETAAYYKSRGMTLYDGLQELYKKHGFFREGVASFVSGGKEGIAKIKGKMVSARENLPANIGPYKVLAVRDYLSGVRTEIADGSKSGLDLPESDVLFFELENGFWAVVRPSGTEPKIKVYISANSRDKAEAEKIVENLSTSFIDWLEAL